MSQYIKKLISEGEHQMLDFKFEISDSRKIARTLVAFANTMGGRLLIGVKDNGAIAGIRTDEEYYMVEGASRLYCKPEVDIKTRQWEVDGKIVLEVIVQEGSAKPYMAKDDAGQWQAYIRQRDENFKAGPVTLKVWAKVISNEGTHIRYGYPERKLMEYLDRNHWITITRFRRLAGIGAERAEDVLVSFLMLGILQEEYIEQDIVYRLKEGYERILEGLEV